LHQDGAEAAQVVSDLAEAVHVVARIKAVGEEPSGEGLSVEEKKRGSALAARLSMPYLSRAWQMLLKGLEETARAPNPLATAEMVLIRLAYTADLPTPDDLIRTLGGGTVPSRAPGGATPKSEPRDERGPLNAAPASRVTASSDDDDGEFIESAADLDGLDPDAPGSDDELGLEGDDATSHVTAPSAHDPRSFADVVALAGLRRDAKLKLHLEDHVSLVKFDAVPGSIDMFLLPGAPPEIANELREKLNSWTGRRWMVMLSKAPGAPALGAVRREREAAELEALKSHPAVRAVLDAFPDAKIAEVRRFAPASSIDESDDESAAG
jgi:DNA polymerase-3 subunit gamma/tau